MQEVWKKIPWTVMNNIGDQFSLDYSKKTWVVSPGEDSFVVSIPVQLNKYLFIFKTADNPRETNVYWVQLIPDSSCTDYTDYTGVQYWIDFQDWTVYGLRYEHNTITNHLDPVVLADCPDWEQSMIRQGYFSVDETSGKILVNDNPAFPMGDDGDLDCPKDPNKPDRKSFIKRITDALGNIGDFLSGGSGGTFLGPTGDYPNPGLGGSGGDYAGGGIIGNTPSNNGTGPTITGASTDPGMTNQTDINGFYLDRLTTADIYFQGNPYGVDCSDLYGLMGNMWLNWQDLASYQIPYEITQRISTIINHYSNRYNNDNFKILKIDEAKGPIVNLDFYALHIISLPVYEGTTTQWTPLEFLNYFRKHIDDFDNIGDNTHVDYGQYNDSGNGGLNDLNKFIMENEYSLGALAHFHLPPLQWPLNTFGWNDGTVIESGFSQSATNLYWIYSTMQSPLDGEHPVSGNRKFGIFPLSDGSYELYIMGVDRITGYFTTMVENVAGGTPAGVLDGADTYWKSIINGAKNYINQNGGFAQLFSTPENGEFYRRFRWDSDYPVVKFLTKQINLQQMKEELHCP